MIECAFKALKQWAESLFPRIKPYFLKGLSAGGEPGPTQHRLKGLVAQVNMMKLLLLNFVNGEIEKKEKGTSLSADDNISVEAVPIPDDVGLEIVEDILDIKISDEPLPPVDENPQFELEGPEE